MRVVRAGLFHVNMLARLKPRIAIGACQWSGVAIVIASTSFDSRTFLKSLSIWVGSPITLLVLSANRSRIIESTSQTCVIRAFLLFAFSAERCADARPFRPMTAN